VWDTAGQEKFRTVSTTYYRGAHGVILAYDISDKKSFEDLKSLWYTETNSYAPTTLQFLVGLKSDLQQEREVEKADAMECAEEWNMGYMEISSLSSDQHQINAPFLDLAKTLLDESLAL